MNIEDKKPRNNIQKLEKREGKRERFFEKIVLTGIKITYCGYVVLEIEEECCVCVNRDVRIGFPRFFCEMCACEKRNTTVPPPSARLFLNPFGAGGGKTTENAIKKYETRIFSLWIVSRQILFPPSRIDAKLL